MSGIITPNTPVFIFDCESIGLHGEVFAVAGGVYLRGEALPGSEFYFHCPRENVAGDPEDREWVNENVPAAGEGGEVLFYPDSLRRRFWHAWEQAKFEWKGIQMAAECLWPVEARFVLACIEDARKIRCWQGPYPFHEIASFLSAAGMDPMQTYDRRENELPAHDPLADARLSARLLNEALVKLGALHRLTDGQSDKGRIEFIERRLANEFEIRGGERDGEKGVCWTVASSGRSFRETIDVLMEKERDGA